MGINPKQLEEIVINPALIALGMNSPAATKLMLGTAAQESHLGSYIVQMGIGFKGGIGIYQMQQGAYNELWENVIDKNVALKAKIRLLLGYDGKPPATRLATDMMLATVMTRLYYWVIKKPLPEADDIAGQAAYWKKWYNTPHGRGTEQEYVDNYNRYVLCSGK